MNSRVFTTLALAASLAASVCTVPSTVRAQPQPAFTALPVPTIAPSAIPTLPPASSSLQLPYPAVGTPAPNVTASYVDPTVPQTITLRQAILIGIAKSPILASARGDIQLARANVDLARVPILPNISAQATIARSHRQPGSTTTATSSSTPVPTTSASAAAGTSFISTDITSTSLTANLRQLIFDGGKTYAQIKSASAGEVSFLDIYRRDLQTVTFNVGTAYYNALAASRTTAVLAQTLQQNQVQLNLVLAQYRAGQASLVDVATAQVPVSQANVNLVRQQGTEAAAQAALANAMGLDANTVVRPMDDGSTYQDVVASSIPIPAYDRAIAQAYMLRPDLASANQTVVAAQYTLRAASLGMVPTVTGNAQAGVASTDPNGGTFRNSWSIGATLNIPIFDQGQTHALVEQAQGNLTKAQANYDSTKLGIQLNVKQTLTALISARAALDATQTEYNQAATVLRATQAQYRAGVTTLPLLLNAQVSLTTALTDQVNAIYALRQAEQAFLYAIGQNS